MMVKTGGEQIMKWLQFFTPVSSISWKEANELIADSPDGGVRILDVRQPSEYKGGHMPGAKLIPVGELDGRLSELDKEKPIIVY
jgi:rhodanese-related sulfurtransferase